MYSLNRDFAQVAWSLTGADQRTLTKEKRGEMVIEGGTPKAFRRIRIRSGVWVSPKGGDPLPLATYHFFQNFFIFLWYTFFTELITKSVFNPF